MKRWLVLLCSFAAACSGGSAPPEVDECAAETNPCGAPHATCTDTPTGYTCGCAAGYAGDGTATGTGCADLDECALGTSSCGAAHATCANTDGGFACGCAAGFTGDGTLTGTGCTDVDECTTLADAGCDNFQCVNTAGSYRCEGLYAVEPFDGVLARLDPTTWKLLDLRKITSSDTVSGVTAMARDPISGTVYAMAKVAGVSGRAFGTLDLDTAEFTVIQGIDKFSSLTFLPDGTLYGMTGAGATLRKTLFTIDPATGTPTVVRSFTDGADGEIICFDSDDAQMYRWSGAGSSVKMQSFGMAMPITAAPVATLTIGEVFGCSYLGDHRFLVHDIGSRVHIVATDGTVSAVDGAPATLFNDVRATLTAPMRVPHTARPSGGPAAGGTEVTLRGQGLTGATAVSFGDTAAASFTVVDDTTITAITAAAAAAGTVDVKVTVPGSFAATWPAAFTFAAAPMLRAPAAASGSVPVSASVPVSVDDAPAVNPAALRKALRGRSL